MKLQLINDINTLKSTDNATQIELAVVDEQQQFIDLSQFEMILVNIGSGGALYSSETPVVNEDGNTFSFTLSNALPVGKYQIQVHLTTHDGKLHIAPHAGSETLTIEKSFNEVSGETIAVISIQKLLDDMASTLATAEAANEKVNDAVAKAESAISTANIATTDAATAVTIANEAKAESATANENASDAVLTANEAKAVADNAKNIADDANVKATQATTDASNAAQTANTASDNATQAVNTANDAKSLANNADSKSDSAVTTANSANDKSSTAINTANTASDTADNALTIAQQANTTAGSADTKASNAVTAADNASTIASDANNKADDAVAKATSAKNTAESVRAEFDTLTSGNTDAELIAARTDESGTTHETLKMRIDSEATKRTNADTMTLQNAKDYTDAQIGDIDFSTLATKDETATAVQSAKDYADMKNVDTLQSAKDYTKAEISKIPPVDLSGYSTTEQVEAKDAEILQQAKQYTDNHVPVIDTSGFATKESVADVSNNLVLHQEDLVTHGVYGVASGTNALTMTISNVSAYVEGMLVAFKNTTESNGATTLNINNLGAKAIVKANGTAVNNLKANAIYQVRYNGVNFILQGEGGEYGTATADDVLSGKTFGTENGLVSGILTLASLGGKKWASGTTENNRAYNTIATFRNKVNGLSFKPSTIIIKPLKSIANPTIYTTNSPGGYAMNAGFGYLISTSSYIQVYGSTVNPLDDGFEFLLQVNGPHTFLSDVTVDWIAYE